MASISAPAPARWTGLAPSTPPWPVTWRTLPPRTRRPPGASPSPTSRATPSGTAAPGPNPRVTPAAGTNPANPARPADLIRPPGPAAPPRRDSPSRPAASTARPADTAPGHCGPRQGPDLIVALDPITTAGLPPLLRRPGPRPRDQAPAPSPDPARHLHQPRLPATRRQLRLRAQHPLRSRRPVVPVQRRPEVPPPPSAQAAPPLERRPAPRRHLPVDHPIGSAIHHRTHPVPDLTADGMPRLSSLFPCACPRTAQGSNSRWRASLATWFRGPIRLTASSAIVPDPAERA